MQIVTMMMVVRMGLVWVVTIPPPDDDMIMEVIRPITNSGDGDNPADCGKHIGSIMAVATPSFMTEKIIFLGFIL